MYTLGIDIGGTFTRYGIIGTNETLNIKKKSTKEISNYIEFITSIVEKTTVEIDTISIGIPGIVNHQKIVSVPNIKLLEQEDFKEQLEKKTNIKVIISKDVNLLFEYHIQELNLINTKNILGFYVGTGLGNVIRINGEIFKGENGFSGELGHIPVIGNTLQCGCGKIGCSETIVSGKALIELHQSHFKDIEFRSIFKERHNHPKIIEFITNMAKIFAVECNILDISTIILGGGVINMPHFPKSLLEESLKQELRSKTIEDNLRLYYANDLPINGIIGADIVARRNA